MFERGLHPPHAQTLISKIKWDHDVPIAVVEVLLNLGMNFGVGVVQSTTPTPKFIPKTSNPVVEFPKQRTNCNE